MGKSVDKTRVRRGSGSSLTALEFYSGIGGMHAALLAAHAAGAAPPAEVLAAFDINAVANRKQLARVSNTPGRTQLINLFRFDEGGARLPDDPAGTVVDLPGYGFAKASKSVKGEWPAMIEGYLLERAELDMVFVLVDGAIGPTKLDAQMLDWLRYNTIAHTVVATKLDKVKSSKRPARKKELAAGCMLDPGDVLWASATKGDGIDRVRSVVRTHLLD